MPEKEQKEEKQFKPISETEIPKRIEELTLEDFDELASDIMKAINDHVLLISETVDKSLEEMQKVKDKGGVIDNEKLREMRVLHNETMKAVESYESGARGVLDEINSLITREEAEAGNEKLRALKEQLKEKIKLIDDNLKNHTEGVARLEREVKEAKDAPKNIEEYQQLEREKTRQEFEKLMTEWKKAGEGMNKKYEKILREDSGLRKKAIEDLRKRIKNGFDSLFSEEHKPHVDLYNRLVSEGLVREQALFREAYVTLMRKKLSQIEKIDQEEEEKSAKESDTGVEKGSSTLPFGRMKKVKAALLQDFRKNPENYWKSEFDSMSEEEIFSNIWAAEQKINIMGKDGKSEHAYLMPASEIAEHLAGGDTGGETRKREAEKFKREFEKLVRDLIRKKKGKKAAEAGATDSGEAAPVVSEGNDLKLEKLKAKERANALIKRTKDRRDREIAGIENDHRGGKKDPESQLSFLKSRIRSAEIIIGRFREISDQNIDLSGDNIILVSEVSKTFHNLNRLNLKKEAGGFIAGFLEIYENKLGSLQKIKGEIEERLLAAEASPINEVVSSEQGADLSQGEEPRVDGEPILSREGVENSLRLLEDEKSQKEKEEAEGAKPTETALVETGAAENRQQETVTQVSKESEEIIEWPEWADWAEEEAREHIEENDSIEALENYLKFRRDNYEKYVGENEEEKFVLRKLTELAERKLELLRQKVSVESLAAEAGEPAVGPGEDQVEKMQSPESAGSADISGRRGFDENVTVEDIIKDNLSYQDADLTEDIKERALKWSLESESAKKYATALKELAGIYGKDIIESEAKKMLEECQDLLGRMGIKSSPYGESLSWAMWDMGKQFHFHMHLDEVDPKYFIADPLASPEKRQEIIDRHIGWEAFRSNLSFFGKINDIVLKDEIRNFIATTQTKPDGELSSKEYAELGVMLRKAFSGASEPGSNTSQLDEKFSAPIKDSAEKPARKPDAAPASEGESGASVLRTAEEKEEEPIDLDEIVREVDEISAELEEAKKQESELLRSMETALKEKKKKKTQKNKLEGRLVSLRVKAGKGVKDVQSVIAQKEKEAGEINLEIGTLEKNISDYNNQLKEIRAKIELLENELKEAGETEAQTEEEKKLEEEIKGMKPEKLRKVGRAILNLGFHVEEKTDNFFAKSLKGLAKKLSKGKEDKKMISENKMVRSLYAMGESYSKNANSARGKMETLDELRRNRKGKGLKGRGRFFAGKESNLLSVSNAGYISSNVIKTARVVGEVAGYTAFIPLRYLMMGSMFFARGAEAIKEAELNSEKAMSKTRIHDIDFAMDEAWNIYNKAKAGKNKVTLKDLKKAYQKEMPKDILDRLESEPLAENSSGLVMRGVQRLMHWDLQRSAEKIVQQLDKVQRQRNISPEEKELRREIILRRYSSHLEDLDRMVSQYGTVDALAMGMRYLSTAGKAVTGGVALETAGFTAMKLWENLPRYFHEFDKFIRPSSPEGKPFIKRHIYAPERSIAASTEPAAQPRPESSATSSTEPQSTPGRVEPLPAPEERGLKENFTLKLGEGNFPKQLERVFQMIAVDEMQIGDKFGVKEGAKSLNIAENLIKLAEGKKLASIAELKGVDFKEIASWNPKTHALEIKSYEKFNNLIKALDAHSEKLWEAGKLKGATEYLHKIKPGTWKSIIHADGMEEKQIIGHDEIKPEQIKDFEHEQARGAGAGRHLSARKRAMGIKETDIAAGRAGIEYPAGRGKTGAGILEHSGGARAGKADSWNWEKIKWQSESGSYRHSTLDFDNKYGLKMSIMDMDGDKDPDLAHVLDRDGRVVEIYQKEEGENLRLFSKRVALEVKHSIFVKESVFDDIVKGTGITPELAKEAGLNPWDGVTSRESEMLKYWAAHQNILPTSKPKIAEQFFELSRESRINYNNPKFERAFKILTGTGIMGSDKVKSAALIKILAGDKHEARIGFSDLFGLRHVPIGNMEYPPDGRIIVEDFNGEKGASLTLRELKGECRIKLEGSGKFSMAETALNTRSIKEIERSIFRKAPVAEKIVPENPAPRPSTPSISSRAREPHDW